MIESIEDAKHLARDLSDNLYYEHNFTPVTFRVFLDSLPTIFRVSILVSFNNDSFINGLANIVFLSGCRKSIGIVFHNEWIYHTYFRSLRKVPFSVHADYSYPF